MRLLNSRSIKCAGVFLQKESRELLRSRSVWVMLALLSVVTGYSFIQAVRLFSEASQTALQFPEMARAMTPMDGVFVPTFGAYYLATTLLFPFIAIRLIGGEKQSGSVKILKQIPLSPYCIVAIKALAIGLVWVAALMPAAVAMVAWRALGGHIYWPETINLLVGHSLYAFAVAAIAFFAAVLADSIPTAAILALACTTGSWILDFAAESEGLLGRMSFLSLTAALRPFERGLFSLESAIALAGPAVGLMYLTGAWLSSVALRSRAAKVILTGLSVAGLWILAVTLNVTKDVSEDLRNSFSPNVESVLRMLDKPMRITVHLSPDDSRLADLERNVLDKLRRLVPRLTVTRVEAETSRGEDRYGVIEYEYDGKRKESRSNSEEEILPILFELSGQSVPADEDRAEYPGYPLVANAAGWGWCFYLALPLLYGLGFWLNNRASLQQK